MNCDMKRNNEVRKYALIGRLLVNSPFKALNTPPSCRGKCDNINADSCITLLGDLISESIVKSFSLHEKTFSTRRLSLFACVHPSSLKSYFLHLLSAHVAYKSTQNLSDYNSWVSSNTDSSRVAKLAAQREAPLNRVGNWLIASMTVAASRFIDTKEAFLPSWIAQLAL